MATEDSSALKRKTTIRRLWGFVRQHRFGFFLSTGAFMCASLTEPLVPAILSKALDSLSQNSGTVNKFNLLGIDISGSMNSIPIWVLPIALVIIFIIRGLLLFLGSYLLSWASTRTVLDLRKSLIQSVIQADASLYNNLNPGIAITQVVTHPQTITNLLGGAVTTILRDGTTVLAMLGYLFYLNWKLTLLALIILPLMALSIKLIHSRAQSIGTRAYQDELRLVASVDDITRAWRVVRTFDAGEWERKRFDQSAKALQRTMLKSASASALMSPVSQVIASFGLSGILGMALMQAQAGNTSPGEFAAFILAMLNLLSSVRRLTDISQPIVGGLITAQGCFDLMDTPPEPDSGTLTIDHCKGHLELKQLRMSYPQSELHALNNLSLSIEAGETIALVGSSGAGKTSVVSALLGFVTPQEGIITLDGIDIRTFRKSALRKQFAVVSQDIVLFDGSLGDNVAYAQVKDPVRLEQCLRAANLWTYVAAQPLGLDTLVGTNGSKLSGGQRQRLAIARALYKEAPIWIFDEATSALDTESERVVQQAIEEWQGRKTLILIAHRLSTVVNANRIYVMSEGRVVEAGKHSELLALNGVYSAMIKAQATT